ncbi:carbohydrate porin [Arachidicoccus sp.]|uniref:carbohydrate porin n=1 Tax=Arachidicoccus sp. TaxID=1872624 RepID=UPI003D19561F
MPTGQNKSSKKLKENGITLGVSEVLEGYNNFEGGMRRGSTYASTFDVNMNIDLQKLTSLRGASFYIDLEDHAGYNPTNSLTGDLQVFDKHNASPFLQILEIWYQQNLFHDKLRAKIGKIDANSEFSVIDNGLEFINSSTQVTPTLFVFPTFPDPVPSINLFFTPSKIFYTSFAIDDANQNAGFLNFYGNPTSIQPTTNGKLFISESGLAWSHLFFLKNDGNFKVGVWKHTGEFKNFSGSVQNGAQGLYLIADQTLWKPASAIDQNRGIRMYLEYAYTDSSISPIYKHFGGGMTWTGLTAKRPTDIVGVSSHYAALSPKLYLPKRDEINIEAFYKRPITHWFNIKPDLQYIIHPGGQFKNALIGTLILSFAFNS